MANRFVISALLVVLSGCATMEAREARPEDPDIAKALAGLVPEKPRSCVSLSEAQGGQNFEETILYRVSSRLTYRADLAGCYGLQRDPILVIDVHSSQLCRGDIVRLVDRGPGGFESGACVFGDFTPYRKPG